MPISEQTYEKVALEDPDGQWELVCGRLRSKPTMTTEHGDAARKLAHLLNVQLDWGEYSVGMNDPKLRISTGTFYMPDVCVVPRHLTLSMRQTPGRFEVYEQPMPLVVEVWSPSTGEYDVERKLQEYQLRGDLEIWRIHPYEKTLIAWQRQSDGSYSQTLHTEGTICPVALPGVEIEIASLFE